MESEDSTQKQYPASLYCPNPPGYQTGPNNFKKNIRLLLMRYVPYHGPCLSGAYPTTPTDGTVDNAQYLRSAPTKVLI